MTRGAFRGFALVPGAMAEKKGTAVALSEERLGSNIERRFGGVCNILQYSALLSRAPENMKNLQRLELWPFKLLKPKPFINPRSTGVPYGELIRASSCS